MARPELRNTDISSSWIPKCCAVREGKAAELPPLPISTSGCAPLIDCAIVISAVLHVGPDPRDSKEATNGDLPILTSLVYFILDRGLRLHVSMLPRHRLRIPQQRDPSR
jgi:hypothetical protein